MSKIIRREKLKTKKKWYAFSEKELEIVREITSGSRNLVELKNKLSIKPNLLTYYSRKLNEKDIIETRKCYYSPQENSEPRKTVSIKETEHALFLKELFQQSPLIKWEKVLSESGVEMLLQATSDSDKTKTISQTTVWRCGKRLEKLGVMTFSAGVYHVKSNLSGLLKFVDAYRAYILKKLLNSVSTEKTRILWHRGRNS